MGRKPLFSLVVGAALGIALVTAPQPVFGQGLMVTGYADIEFTVAGVGSGDEELFFDNHHFNLIFMGSLIKNVFAAAEVEYEHAGEEIALEYGYISYTGFKNLRIMGGKFIVPFGRFNKDLHPTWINKIPGRPHGFRNVFPQTYSDVGLWVSGGVPVGRSGARVVYDAWVVNGLMGADSGDIRGMRGNDRVASTTRSHSAAASAWNWARRASTSGSPPTPGTTSTIRRSTRR
jgi:hypothetical protein